MILSINEQARLFTYVFIAGLASGALYDLIEILRLNVKHKSFFIYVEDIIYWLVVIMLLFLFMLDKNHAEIRLFDIAGFFGGMLIYNFLLSPFVIKALMFVIKIIKLIIKLLVEIIMTPIRLIWLVIGKPVRKAEDFLKGYLKKVLHLSAVYAKVNKRRIDNQLRFIRRKKE